MDKLRRMEIFATVANAGHFGRAAELLNLSKSAVSYAVRDIEAYLGLQLIVRNNRTFLLTDSGQSYLAHCMRVLSEIDEFEDQLRGEDHDLSGTLRVTVPMSYGTYILAPLIAEFMKEYSSIYVTLNVTDKYVDLVEDSDDVAIRIGDPADSSMIGRRLASIKMRICASPQYVSLHGNPQSLEDLANLNCFRYSGAPTWHLYHQSKELLFHPKGKLISNGGEAIREMTIHGGGISYLPDFTVDAALDDGRLVEVLEEYADKEYPIFALSPALEHKPLRAIRFIDFLASNLKQ